MKIEAISVVGLGYIGLPTAAVIASRKRKVIGFDVNEKAVNIINSGQAHIVEPDLDALVRSVVADGFLRATTVAEPADAFLIAVPTPFLADHAPDLRFIEAACKSIAPVLKAGNLVILESTSPVGATEQMAEWLAISRPDLTFPQTHGEESDVRIAHCPERVLPGKVLHELVQNDRVIGGMTSKCSSAAVDLYQIFVEGKCVTTTARTAELCKLAENSFRDVNIAFANELSIICDKLDVDIWSLIKLANLHPRVNILQPGPGVGGHCIAVDPWFIVSSSPKEARLIRTAREVNDHKPEWVLAKIDAAISKFKKDWPDSGRQATVACFGLAFKPNIDDLRESPAVEICLRLAQRAECTILAVEPNITDLPPTLAGKATLVSMKDAFKQADILVLLVDHDQFSSVDKSDLVGKALVDTRGLWPPSLTATEI